MKIPIWMLIVIPIVLIGGTFLIGRQIQKKKEDDDADAVDEAVKRIGFGGLIKPLPIAQKLCYVKTDTGDLRQVPCNGAEIGTVLTGNVN